MGCGARLAGCCVRRATPRTRLKAQRRGRTWTGGLCEGPSSFCRFHFDVVSIDTPHGSSLFDGGGRGFCCANGRGARVSVYIPNLGVVARKLTRTQKEGDSRRERRRKDVSFSTNFCGLVRACPVRAGGTRPEARLGADLACVLVELSRLEPRACTQHW